MGRSKQKSDQYTNLIFNAKNLAQNRIVIGIPMTGILRSEWALARYGQVIPCNWSHTELHGWMNQFSPIGYAVAEARNLVVHKFIEDKAQWLLFIDHDVILVWSNEKRVITGADILGRLLRGIAIRSGK